MILGCDVSRHQGNIDFGKMKTAGAKFVVIRCTVGDYYTDDAFVENWKKAKDAGLYVAPYLVVAPATSAAYGNRYISADSHFDYFMDAFGDRKPDFPIVLDVELHRNRSRDQISHLLLQLVARFKNDVYDRGWKPIIYTAQSFWDTHVSQDVWWTDGYSYLFPARWSTSLTSPWSDGYYKFAGWNNWTFWQWSADGNYRGKEFGASSRHIDLDYFNGSLSEFQQLFGLEETEPEPELPDTVLVDVGWLGLNFRNVPTIVGNRPLGKFYNGLELSVVEETENWYKVKLEKEVWIHKRYTK